MARTARSRRAAREACSFRYGHEAPKQLLVYTLGTVYSVVNPVIVPFAAIYFAFGFVVLKYKMLYVFLPKYEGEGFVWPLLVRGMLLSLIILHLTLLGFFGLKDATYELVLVLPLPLATFYMERYWDEAFQRPAKFPPICLLSTGAAQGGDYPEPDAEGPSVAQAKEDEDLAQYGGRDLYLSPVLATPYLFLDFQNVRDEEEDDNDGLLSRSAPESRR
jgi:hypothetical protein